MMTMKLDLQHHVYALVTSTTYGNWLPGEERGYVDGNEQNLYGTPYRTDNPELKEYARNRLDGGPVFFDTEQAEIVLAQWQKEVQKLAWHFFIVALMPNHFHLVVAASKETDKAVLLNRFKSRASFALNKRYGKQTWWTESGSVRFCFDAPALQTRIDYVRNQQNPLVVWENSEKF